MLPHIEDLEHYCVFLDFDGTLVEIEDHPDDVQVDASTLQYIERLRGKVDDSLALISGRDIDVIDRLLYPLILPVAGVHGLQRRDAGGYLHTPLINQCVLDDIVNDIQSTFYGETGVVIEKKTGAIALHYRLRPDFEARCVALAEKIENARPELHLIKGKMVCEIRLEGNDKGAVIEAFLAERPFKGRRPIFAGDDATDESGFAAVNACGGISIKVGENPTSAMFRATSVLELRNWFEELLKTARSSMAQ
jgi:trehalose 6-phosphate phosphatase